MRFHFIYLAAGFSRRFGGNKLLAVYEGEQLYRILLMRLSEILRSDERVQDLTVVTQYTEISDFVASIGNDSIRCVINPDPARGISSSLQCGVHAVSHDTVLTRDDIFVFFVADEPHLRRETIEKFLTAFDESGMRLGCIGDGSGEMGNPCAFAYEFLPELMSLTGDKGGKKILIRHREAVFIFFDTIPDELADVDYKW